MGQIKLTAQPREAMGKEGAKKMRREGLIPSILYGPTSKKAIPLSLREKELENTLFARSRGGGNPLVNLRIEGEGDERVVIFKGSQRHPVTGRLLHIDLYEVLMDRKIVVEVPLHLVGKAEGVAMGGILEQEVRTIKVECLPTHIPDRCEVDVTHLAIGDSLHIRDIRLPEGIKVKENPALTIVSIVAPTVEVAVKTAEEVKAEIAKSFEEKPKEEKTKE